MKKARRLASLFWFMLVAVIVAIVSIAIMTITLRPDTPAHGVGLPFQ